MPVLVTLVECFQQFGLSREALVHALDSWRRVYGRKPDFMVLTEPDFSELIRLFAVSYDAEWHGEYLRHFRAGSEMLESIPVVPYVSGPDSLRVGLYFVNSAFRGPSGVAGPAVIDEMPLEHEAM